MLRKLLLPYKTAVWRLSQEFPKPGGPPSRETEMKNYVLATTLLAFTGSVYYYAMFKMKASDDVLELENEGKVNLHESGLKVTKKPPRSVHDL